jgi:hypothetical protein
MPYIEKKLRERLDYRINDLLKDLDLSQGISDGEANYVITRIIDSIYTHWGYLEFERAIGLLECIKQEYYRRRVAPYEDKKCAENGDVF